MLSADSAHNSRWETAEVVFGIPFLISLAIQFVVPFSVPQGILQQALTPAGIALVLVGVVIVVLARREFAHYGQPTDPGQPTMKVVKTGVFSVSRNPLYLASILIFLGIALALNNIWAIVTLLISTILCHYVLIVPEERYLADKFGEEYTEYTASVRRWLGHK